MNAKDKQEVAALVAAAMAEMMGGAEDESPAKTARKSRKTETERKARTITCEATRTTTQSSDGPVIWAQVFTTVNGHRKGKKVRREEYAAIVEEVTGKSPSRATLDAYFTPDSDD